MRLVDCTVAAFLFGFVLFCVVLGIRIKTASCYEWKLLRLLPLSL